MEIRDLYKSIGTRPEFRLLIALMDHCTVTSKASGAYGSNEILPDTAADQRSAIAS